MIKNHNFLSLFAITLCAALLLSMGSRATRVFALADPVQAIAPVFDTQIYQLQDYIDNGGMTGSQLDIFYFLAGALAVGQLGAQDAKIVDPYANSDSVIDWLKSCGIELYNALIGLVPAGDYYVGIDYPTKGLSREQLQAIVSLLMGDAVVAATYPDLETYLDENSSDLYIPFNRDLQLGVNGIFGLNGGAYEWQQRQLDWSNGDFIWYDSGLSGTALTEYNSQVNNLPYPHRLASNKYSNNMYWPRGIVVGFNNFDAKYDLFINTSNHTVSFHNYPSYLETQSVFYYDGRIRNETIYLHFTSDSYNPNNFQNYKQIASYFLNYVPSDYTDVPKLVNGYRSGYWYFKNTDFLDRVMVGATWDTAVEITNTSDLNFSTDNLTYYNQVQTDYLLDIWGLINGLVNNYVIPTFTNLVTPDGVLVHDVDLLRVTQDIFEIIQVNNPAIPVNLNEVSDYLDNTYLDLVKEHGENFGETIGEYVAFWHNADPELTYVIFGALILTLIGAFVGKWGHS